MATEQADRQIFKETKTRCAEKKIVLKKSLGNRATALGHVIGRGQDQVGLAVLDGGLRELIPPGSTRAGQLAWPSGFATCSSGAPAAAFFC